MLSVLVAAVSVGCGGSGEASETTTTTMAPMTTEAPAASDAPAPAPTEAPTTTVDQRSDAERFAAVMPTVEDLGPGWSVNTGFQRNEGGSCLFDDPYGDIPLVVFGQSPEGPFAAFAVSDEERSGSFDTLAERLENCEDVGPNGEAIDYVPTGFLQLGDGTFAYKALYPQNTADIVIVRVGDLILQGAGTTQTQPFDIDILAGVLTKMVERARG